MKHTLALLTIAVLLTGCSPQSCDNSQSCSRWQSIFNGKDLSGWHVRCLPADKDKTFWSVEVGSTARWWIFTRRDRSGPG